MKLRELTAVDAPRCAELEIVLFPGESPWPAAAFVQEIAQPHTFYLGVEDEETHTLVGYAGIGMMGPAADPEFEIHTIGVDPAAQRRGVGRMMMDNIVYNADLKNAPVFLEVRVGNDPAIGLYEAYGFIKTGIRRNYYQPSGADAHTMFRPRSSERTAK
ncbi:ribosomal protein S18-alanine N-acetyltransferase [Corynebacterium striatum]|uniref:ribosomal protein S18-alanine N-acetyltransferase n=1 Tax=Corynebacterium striatum TaxID=43770 RepID=UPI00254C9098|nr:ribosomal protein S18-alanine N-acetyltransferase [Corynebacterium striatum]MDK8833747.1 ribosomal protein S18-alanine N-acetyltransferase [Corynebacterium striatum]HCD1919002.1 ribosomal protein S18-alanine N-acetyltransferase [Corynebacterium striatum]